MERHSHSYVMIYLPSLTLLLGNELQGNQCYGCAVGEHWEALALSHTIH